MPVVNESTTPTRTISFLNLQLEFLAVFLISLVYLFIYFSLWWLWLIVCNFISTPPHPYWIKLHEHWWVLKNLIQKLTFPLTEVLLHNIKHTKKRNIYIYMYIKLLGILLSITVQVISYQDPELRVWLIPSPYTWKLYIIWDYSAATTVEIAGI